MSNEIMNALAQSSSAYLRSAMHQPVRWNEWGEAAFAQAERENKPILLDIGAVWCHWCHVMDRESYENAATAELINEHFIAVKVDRDERPDVDTRYQAAVSAISGQGGWPLTAFLTPDGRPFFGGTYFPPEERYGRPSFQRVLRMMAESFRDRRDEVNESAGSVMQAIEYNESFSGRASDVSGEMGARLVGKIAESALKQFDPQHGGFGSQPKFPHPGALDLLTDIASRVGLLGERAQVAVMVTLDKMQKGGIYDQLAGGFHRYSVDERWVVPHFEKMAYDNAEMLKSYVRAFQTMVEPSFAATAEQTIGWMDAWLSDREHGGFYGSQDADLSLDDDGDYFTWSQAEAKAVLGEDELKLAAVYFDIGEVGDMHHDPARNVLHVKYTVEEAARRAGVDGSAVELAAMLAGVKEKLYAARLLRPVPFVDKTVYTGWNGLCIGAYLLAGRVLQRPEVRAFAVKSLDRLLAAAWRPGEGLGHVVAYGDAEAQHRWVHGVLDDYVFVGQASLDAWSITGELRYYTVAEQIAEILLARFYDMQGGGFFDAEVVDGALGALSARRKPLQDSPTPAGNPAAADLLLRLWALSEREEFRIRAEETLETFAGVVEHFGLYAATFGLALERLVLPAVQVVIVGEDERAQQLETVALARFAVNKTVVRVRRDQFGALPPALAETLPHLPEEAESLVLVCTGRSCLAPIVEAEALIEALNAAL